MIKKVGLKSLLVSIIIMLQPIISQITAIMVRNTNFQVTLGMIYNGLIMLFGIIYILFISKSKYRKKSILYLILLLIFCTLYFIFKYKIFSISYFIKEAIFMFKYLYYPCIIVFLINLFDSEDFNMNSIENSIKFSMIIYCLLILIAEISGTSYLSYQNSYAGKMGWFYSSNEIGTLLVILLPYMFLNFKKNIKLNIVLLFISVLTVLLIGTKTSFLGLLLIIIIILIYLIIKVSIKKRIIILSLIILSIVSVFVINPPAIKNMKQSTSYYLGSSKVDNVDIVPSNAKLSFLIFGERASFFENEYNQYINSDIEYKLFGIGFTNIDPTTDYKNHLVEMDFIDILFKYGIIGFIIYLFPLVYTIYNILKSFIKNKIKLNFSDIIYIHVIVLTYTISFFAGHVLGSPSVSIFLALTQTILFYRTIRRMN